jgi:LmbE family N-acetylglucosaminyl deacetylase
VTRRPRLAALLLAAACAGRRGAPTVAAGTRLVVVAPHPDDETIAAGGLIQRVLGAGGTVDVVVVTDGDGYVEAAAALTGHDQPTAPDFVALGRTRRDEELAAAAVLGVPTGHVHFLGYPDDGLEPLLDVSWGPAHAYVSTHTGRGPFTGAGLHRRLSDVLCAARPTLVVTADPADVHPDHAATGRFTLAAVLTLAERPRVLTYLVHDPEWPPPLALDEDMPAPDGVRWKGARWWSLELTEAERDTKLWALAGYRTQLQVLGGLLERFLRRSEVFHVPAAGR